MKQIFKIMITVFVSLMSCLVMIACIYHGYNELKYLKYELQDMIYPQLVSAEAEYLGKSYHQEAKENASYYKIKIRMKNDSNYTKKCSNIYFRMQSAEDDTYYWITDITETSAYYDNSGCLPAGKEGVVSRIISVEDGCRSFYLIYGAFDAKEKDKQKLLVNL